MWRKMKEYVEKNNIDLVATSFSLLEVLEDLYDLRNKGAHGDVITKEEYKTISEYKNLGVRFRKVGQCQRHRTIHGFSV
jgi:hypothetical protein